MVSAVGYNPDDPLQTGFLSSLALGETGGNANALTEGVGGADLSSLIAAGRIDGYGFPQWSGQGNSHAAGAFQFEPGTWDAIAQEYGLNFNHPGDQAEGAWMLAQQTDPSLETDLSTGNFGAIQTALRNIWPSVTGNGAAPQGLANDLGTAIGGSSWVSQDGGNVLTLVPQTSTPLSQSEAGSGFTGLLGSLGIIWNDISGNKAAADSIAATNAGGQVASGQISDAQGAATIGVPAIGNWFVQGGLIIVGAVIILVALWMLLSSQGVVPTPVKVGHAMAA